MAKGSANSDFIASLKAFANAAEVVGTKRLMALLNAGARKEKAFDVVLNVTCSHYRLDRKEVLGSASSIRKDSMFVLIYVLHKDYGYRFREIAQLVNRHKSVIVKYVGKFSRIDLTHPSDKKMWDNYEAIRAKAYKILSASKDGE